MKTLEFKITVEVKDSACAEDFVSDIGDGLLCDDLKRTTVEYVENGTLQTAEFENEDFEE